MPDSFSPSDGTEAISNKGSAPISSSPSALPAQSVAPAATNRKRKRQRKVDRETSWWPGDEGEVPTSAGLWHDIQSGRWMIIPSSSGTLLAASFALYAAFPALARLLPSDIRPESNPFQCLWELSYPTSPLIGQARYVKGLKDFAFLLNHIITFSFIRQFATLHVLRPLALEIGIRGSKVLRFQEQSYCMVYWGISGLFGVHLLRGLPSWYLNTAEFWRGYPFTEMTRDMKLYYLLQFSFWLHQLIIVVLKIEKPRKDYYQLVVHHFVTIWLVGWSYLTSMTPIGTAVFVTMDLSDSFFALAKCINYSEGPTSSGLGSAVAFGWFVIVWSYMRHYLNFWILYSVWFDFKLIPSWNQAWRPSKGIWMAPFMRYQIFGALSVIQALNLYWYFLIWRVLIRAIQGVNLADDRSDDEDEGEEDVDDRKTR